MRDIIGALTNLIKQTPAVFVKSPYRLDRENELLKGYMNIFSFVSVNHTCILQRAFPDRDKKNIP
jgi:hypothetical protein